MLGFTSQVCKSFDNHMCFRDFYIFREHVHHVQQQQLEQLGYQQKDAENGQSLLWLQHRELSGFPDCGNICGRFVKIAEIYRKERELHHGCTQETE